MASTTLTRTPSSNGNQKTWTFSCWIKRTALGGSPTIIDGYYGNSSRYTTIYFDSNDNLDIFSGVYSTSSTSTLFQYTSNRRFRDTNSWYHLVIVCDTTQATAGDRIKLYVNGVRETSFGTETQPAQNGDSFMNVTTSPMRMGQNSLDAVLSHVHFIDGTAYQASTFGSTDSTTGEWKINTSPSVTYGTNGFFIFKDSASVTDQSGNSNNLTVNAGTLTNTEDCPNNVFATINTLQGAIATGYTVANGSLGITGNTGGAWRSLPATLTASSGKFYWEVKITGFATGMHFGIQDVDQAPQSNAYAYQYSRAYMYKDDGGIANNNSTASYGNSWTTNDIVGVAVDLDNNKIYFSKNGTFQNSGDPTSGSTGTGAAYTIASGYSYTPMFSTYASGDTFQYNFGNGFFGTTAISSEGTNASNIGKFEYDVPTGYTALSTKGLNE